MVLHTSFTHRASTQDIDYIHRAFAAEYRAVGFPDAEQRLRKCIAETAAAFNLGADWMNDHADVALPMALECVLPFAYLKTNQPTNNQHYITTPQQTASTAGRTTRYSPRRHGKRTRCRRRYSTSADSPSSRCPGPGRSRSSSSDTPSRTPSTAPPSSGSASRSAAYAGPSRASSSGSWSAAGPWAIPGTSRRSAHSSACAYRTP